MKKTAFTLIELSIVLVIIGLIVGGVLVGQNLIASAKIRSVISETHQYEIAINLFKDTYRKLPGDMENAYQLWDSSCATSAALCNGDGDNLVEYATDEDVMVWKHLSLAGLLKSDFSGSGRVIGTNMPTSRLEGAGWWFIGTLNNTTYSSNRSGHLLELASNGGTYLNDKAMPPIFAKGIDDKIDDGEPGIGKIWTLRGASVDADNTKCVNKAYNGTPPVTYLLSDNTSSCRLILWYD